jgi:uncharacterized protein
VRTVTYLNQQHHRRSGRALAMMGGVLLPHAPWNAWHGLPHVRRITLFHPDLPAAFDRLRIVQVSDVHAGTFMPPSRLYRVLEAVQTLRPDLVAFTGDQLDRRDVDAEFFVHGFAGIEAPLGVFGVLGNHDHIAGADLAIAGMQAVGITPLVNQGATIERGGARILVAGVDDPDSPPGCGPDLGVLWRREAAFRLLLCHQPKLWHEAIVAGAHLTLAGHTHGGQIVLHSGNLSVARLSTPYVAGPYVRSGALLYVSRGVGVGAIPIRYGVPPEIDCITLHRGVTAAF